MTVNGINATLLNEMSGNAKEYKSIDTVLDPESSVAYPTEFLNTLDLSGMPPHNLKMKIGCPVMLLRNLGTHSFHQYNYIYDANTFFFWQTLRVFATAQDWL